MKLSTVQIDIGGADGHASLDVVEEQVNFSLTWVRARNPLHFTRHQLEALTPAQFREKQVISARLKPFLHETIAIGAPRHAGELDSNRSVDAIELRRERHEDAEHRTWVVRQCACEFEVPLERCERADRASERHREVRIPVRFDEDFRLVDEPLAFQCRDRFDGQPSLGYMRDADDFCARGGNARPDLREGDARIQIDPDRVRLRFVHFVNSSTGEPEDLTWIRWSALDGTLS